ncbi:MAG TPA: Txe/YoeB family addiction module toxin [Paraburkholderia sp.]|nr:Txe/YoeB family addiction module toxin [Paraburkholderia sp.]
MIQQKRKAKNKAEAVNAVEVAWSSNAWDDYRYWQATDMAIVREINGLLEETSRDPFRGTGKPEPLKGSLTGFGPRRITKADRLVYIVQEGVTYVMQCRYHYRVTPQQQKHRQRCFSTSTADCAGRANPACLQPPADSG